MGKGTLTIWRIHLTLRALIQRFLTLLSHDNRIHKAHFARTYELTRLLSPTPSPGTLLVGTNKQRDFLSVAPTKTRRELGNMLVVAPTRGGKGLLAVSQLLSWKHSVVVNDIKGDLFTQTAGYRRTLGPVFVIDPQGIGHRFDPLHNASTEDQLLEAVHGRARAHVLRDNMETQLYYRPADLDTADYLEHALGRVSEYAHSQTKRQGTDDSSGLSE